MIETVGKAVESRLAGESAPVESPAIPLERRETLTQVSSRTGDIEKVSEDDSAPAEDTGVLEGLRLYTVFGSLMLGIFLFALDQSIVATAIPIFTSEFNAFSQVGWVITGYFLTQCGLILFVGQLLTILKAKWILLVAFFLFELGSLIAGVAKSMTVLILGRAIQGVGASAMYSSIMLIVTIITRVEQRAAFMASFGSIFVISSVIGPLLGGVFTQHATWRWCFYINLPIGGIAALAVFFLLPARPPHENEATKDLTLGQKFARMDFLGTILIFGIITCLLLALGDGGNAYAWSNWRIIFEFVLAGVLIIVFGAWQVYLGDRALMPTAILKNRTEIAASISFFMAMLSLLGGTYQLPLFYEAVQNHSPTKAGIDIILFMVSCCVGIFFSGAFINATGRYYPWLLIGPPFAAVGFGLLSTIDANTSSSKLYGYQFLSGFGVGLAFQTIGLSVQAEYHDRSDLMAQAIGVVNFFQLTGAAVGIGIVDTVLSVYLNKALHAKAPDVPFDLVRQSVTAVWSSSISDEQRPRVIAAYVEAITKSFLPIYVATAISFCSSLFIRNLNIKNRGGPKAAAV